MEAGLNFYLQTLKRFDTIFPTLSQPQVSFAPREADFIPCKDEYLSVEQLECAALRLYHQQEYYRQAYNETLNRMESLKDRLPGFSLSYLSGPQFNAEQLSDDELTETFEMDPELVEFMIQTIKHREERDREASSNHHRNPQERPPPPKSSCSFDPKSSLGEISRLETDIVHHYTHCSPCRDSPFWPFLPLRKI
ncbi:hypothetical protein EG68_06709 [Paragonimus skrjabini miyazakii]|uniref:Uncharacterized protein n=1 Tax=Paragonimus skrjabini miyazakii TaxID=59628 RepID=A0A8S9YN04_9TREM|nr:hypothetical protein EG68_06709 [Paragonimus skrjabini miyazakii]